ncbi:MAG: hypothetical protein AAGF32_10425, partial [Pseudomonadota bacterium]
RAACGRAAHSDDQLSMIGSMRRSLLEPRRGTGFAALGSPPLPRVRWPGQSVAGSAYRRRVRVFAW